MRGQPKDSFKGENEGAGYKDMAQCYAMYVGVMVSKLL